MKQESDPPIAAIPGVVDVAIIRGVEASSEASADLLVEVPHGADRQSDYDALRGRLRGDLPPDLRAFFHFNTDVGAWAYGRATAAAVLAAQPQRTALIVRSLIPRTFIDCNRPADFGGDASAKLTAGLHTYIRDAHDQTLLKELHEAYVATAEAAFAAVCGRGGFALIPHTYGPRTLDIPHIGDDIGQRLREALTPEQVERWPLRPEIDLLTRDPDGTLLAPEGVEESLLTAFREAGLQPEANHTYCLHPPSLAHTFSARYPGQVLCLEVRRDLLVDEWRPFDEMRAEAHKAERIAAVLSPVVANIPPP